MTLTHVVLHDCHVSGSGSAGGGIYMTGTSTLIVNGNANGQSEFKECAAPRGNGGAIYNGSSAVNSVTGATVSIVNTLIDGHFMHPGNITGPSQSEEPETGAVPVDDNGEVDEPEPEPATDPSGEPVTEPETEPTGAELPGHDIIATATHLEDDVENAVNGGAVYMGTGTLSMGGDGTADAVTIRNCTVTGKGGAIYSISTSGTDDGTVKLKNVTIDGHDQSRPGTTAGTYAPLPATFVNAVDGGAVYIHGGTMRITGGELRNLRAMTNGGVIYSSNSTTKMSAEGTNKATVLINGTTINGRTVSNDDTNGHVNAANGGAIYNYRGNLRMEDASILNCRVSKEGGAIYDENTYKGTDIDTVNLQNVTIDGHDGLPESEPNAQLGGGVFIKKHGELNGGGSLRMNQCKLLDCVASSMGGAIYNESTRRTASTGVDDEPTVHLLDTVIDGHDSLPSGIYNASRGGAILLANGTLKIEGTSDGSSEIRDCTTSTDGGAITSYGSGTQFRDDKTGLKLGEYDYTIKLKKTTIADCSTNYDGGAIKIKQILIMLDASIINCHAGTDGGAISLFGDSGNVRDIRMNDSTFNHNVISGNTAVQNGAGIYLPAALTSKLSISGQPDFGGRGVDGDGNITAGKITVKRKIDASGNASATVRDVEVTAGNFVLKDSGFKTGGEEPKNGMKNYQKDTDGKYMVRQDIYIGGYIGTTGGSPTPAPSLIVTGALSNTIDTNDVGDKDGSIWVWAEIPATADENNHYQQLKQFAVYSDAFAKLTEAQRTASARVFRNAVDDAATENGTDTYLMGTLEGDLTGNYIYWTGASGSREVILRKVTKTSYTPLRGAKFDIFRGTGSNPYVVKDKTDPANDEELKDKASLDSGVIWIGILPYGVYYLKEKEPPNKVAGVETSDYSGNADKWFYMEVGDNGVVMSEAYADRASAKAAYDAAKAAP
jgi:hypothetical protein